MGGRTFLFLARVWSICPPPNEYGRSARLRINSKVPSFRLRINSKAGFRDKSFDFQSDVLNMKPPFFNQRPNHRSKLR